MFHDFYEAVIRGILLGIGVAMLYLKDANFEGLRLTLQVAKDIIPKDEIYLRVNKDNPASLKVMLNNGGYIHHEEEYKYYVRIRKNDLKR